MIEYELYVPSVGPNGKKIKNPKVSQVRRSLVLYFGGLTDTRQKNKGIWKIGGIEVRDEIIIWRVLSTKGKLGDKQMRIEKRNLERALAQKEILVIRRAVAKLT